MRISAKADYAVVEHVTVADAASGELPCAICELAEDPEAWVTR